jgi:undecaprenyl-diphosphatase
VTPGNLGLELTTLLALLAVCTFSFFLLGDLVLAPGEPRIDRWAEDVAARLRSDVLVEAARLVTVVGASTATAIAVALTALWAALRRRPIEAVALVAGWLTVLGAVHVAKALYDRPRPAGSLVETMYAAYPSGHTAYAVALVACAAVLVRGGVGWAVRIAAVTVALVLVAVVAVTRVYLRAHYLTDVLGAIALGFAVWALVGVLALVAGHIRHNGARTT